MNTLDHAVAMREADYSALLKILQGSPSALAAPARSPGSRGAAGGPGWTIDGSVAVVPLRGVVLPTRSEVLDFYGIAHAGLDEFVTALDEANASPSVESVVLDISSPGGSVAGVADAALAVATSPKPVIAYARDLMASAAYWIGSQAQEIVGGAAPIVGSIGVYQAVQDWSGLFGREGVRVDVVRSGPAKGVGVFGAPFTEADRAVLQKEIDALHREFVGAVARGRTRLGMEALLALADGSVKIGADAVSSGLVDRLQPIHTLVQELNHAHRPRHAARPTAAHAAPAPTRKEVMDPTPTETAAPLNSNTPGTPGTPGTPKTEGTAAPVTGAGVTPANAQDLLRFAGRFGGGAVAAAHTAILGGLGDAQAREAVLDAVAKERTPVSVSVAVDARDKQLEAFTLATVARAEPGLLQALRDGHKGVAKALGFDTPELAEKAVDEARRHVGRKSSLLDIAERCALADFSRSGRGAPRIYGADDVLVAAYAHGRGFTVGGSVAAAPSHGTGDFPLYVGSVIHRVMMGKFALAPTSYERWCKIGESKDFRPQTMLTLSHLEELEDVPEGKRPGLATIGERAESVRVRTKGKRFSLSRQMIINDDAGALSDWAGMMGQVSALAPERVAIAVLENSPNMSDGFPLFHANHLNILTAAALSQAAIKVAINSFHTRTDFGPGKLPAAATPRKLLVPTALEIDANTYLASPTDLSGSNAAAPNPVRGRLEVVASRYLTSLTKWFVLADAMEVPTVQLNFLNGNRLPIVTNVGDGSILGMDVECIFDVGAAPVHFEGAAVNAGA